MRQRILSGIQPSGDLNIGHYIGAMKSWLELQRDFEALFMIVNLHAITVRQDPEVLRERTLSIAAQYIACGIDPDEAAIFIQSDVMEHAQLAWILNCHTGLGELQRMTQFKDKSLKQGTSGIYAGLLNYPVLMASDILLYRADRVPVGEDQKQHLELTRDLAERMNSLYGDIFTVPTPHIATFGARIMSLQEPESKMSKSDENPKANILLLDEPGQILKKFKAAVTDSENRICFDVSNQPGVSNLLTIFASVTSRTMEESVAHFEGRQYGHLKVETAEAVAEFLRPVREKYADLMQDKAELLRNLKSGADRASLIAAGTLAEVEDALGLRVHPC